MKAEKLIPDLEESFKSMRSCYSLAVHLPWDTKWHSIGQNEFCYIIQAVGGGPIKIGKAGDPGRRLKEIQTGYPYELKIVRLFRFPYSNTYGAMLFENDMHRFLSKYRLRGEWFDESALDIISEDIRTTYESNLKRTG
jgi:hypothetical protein